MTRPLPRRPEVLPDDPFDVEPSEPMALRRTLLAVCAIAVLVLAVGGGWLLRGGSSTPSADAPPAANSVDAGFARDMSTHHIQAVTMANYERDNTSNAAMRILATDIETEQNFQVGQMSGWLNVWGLSRVSTNQMAWMGPGMGIGPSALMPGMATPEQMTTLQTLHGRALDIMFLQLMIRHHQGGVTMAQYAAAHAGKPFVRQLAQAMVTQQSSEIVQMEQLLRGFGAQPLPSPN